MEHAPRSQATTTTTPASRRILPKQRSPSATWKHEMEPLPSPRTSPRIPAFPALFITYANSFLDTLSGHVKGQLYADDLIIWKELHADVTDALDLQLTLRKLEDRARTHEMRFNEGKTQTISISRLRKVSTPQLRFNNHPLTPSQQCVI